MWLLNFRTVIGRLNVLYSLVHEKYLLKGLPPSTNQFAFMSLWPFDKKTRTNVLCHLITNCLIKFWFRAIMNPKKTVQRDMRAQFWSKIYLFISNQSSLGYPTYINKGPSILSVFHLYFIDDFSHRRLEWPTQSISS